MSDLTSVRDVPVPARADSIVAKLTADRSGEPPSAMRVVGCDRHFHYGAAAGASGCFLARLHHASVEPESPDEHLKIAFFFRKSTVGERRAKRAMPMVEADTASELVKRRQMISTQLGRTALAAEHALGV